MKTEEVEIIEELVTAIDIWSSNEDGIPEFVWGAYIRALNYLGVPYSIENDIHGEPKIVFSSKGDDHIRRI